MWIYRFHQSKCVSAEACGDIVWVVEGLTSCSFWVKLEGRGGRLACNNLSGDYSISTQLHSCHSCAVCDGAKDKEQS